MMHGKNAMLVGVRRGEPATVPGAFWRRRDSRPLAVVAVAFTLAQLLPRHTGDGARLGRDGLRRPGRAGHAPAAFFSAPRARGVSVLVAPIAPGLVDGRTAGVSRRPVRTRACSWPCGRGADCSPPRARRRGRAVREPVGDPLLRPAGHAQLLGRRRRAGVRRLLPARRRGTGRPACAVGPRPERRADDADASHRRRLGDAAAAVAAAAVPRLRRLRPVLVLAGGLLAGAPQWVVEAYTGYGGLGQRLADASRHPGRPRLNIAVLDQARSLGGRGLCRPCAGDLPGPAATRGGSPAAGRRPGLVLAVRARRAAATVLLVACAATAAVPYLFMIGYAAPRFLLPAYALLAIPVADVVVRLVTRPGGACARWRRPWSPSGSPPISPSSSPSWRTPCDRTTARPGSGRDLGRTPPARRTAALPADRRRGHPRRLLRPLRPLATTDTTPTPPWRTSWHRPPDPYRRPRPARRHPTLVRARLGRPPLRRSGPAPRAVPGRGRTRVTSERVAAAPTRRRACGPPP